MRKPSYDRFEAPRSIEKFLFRNLHPKILMGTASDQYTGWIGQIYTKKQYKGRIIRRTIHRQYGNSPRRVQVMDIWPEKDLRKIRQKYLQYFDFIDDLLGYIPTFIPEGSLSFQTAEPGQPKAPGPVALKPTSLSTWRN